MKRKRQPKHVRRGLEVIEAALTLPLLSFVMFTGVQIAHKIHVQSLLKLAASEAIVAAGLPEGTREDAVRVFNEHTGALGLVNCQLEGLETIDNATATNDQMWIRPMASASDNQLPLPVSIDIFDTWIFGGRVYYHREGL